MFPVDAGYLPDLIGYDLVRKLNTLPPERALPLAQGVLLELGEDKAFMKANVDSLVEREWEPGSWYIAQSWDDGTAHSCSFHAIAWTPGSKTSPHPHDS